MVSTLSIGDRFTGCLVAGACGDALGASVEFLQEDQIFLKYGARGIDEFDVAEGEFTDDTQMTLFTAEGILSALLSVQSSVGNLETFRAEDAVPGLHQAYLRWLATQKEASQSPLFKQVQNEGMLIKQKELWNRRAPGQTCRMSIKSGAVGSPHNKINNSKGCGGIMRVAPCGLIVHSAFPFLSADGKAELAFKLGALAAAITHTHPSGWLSSGCQAAIISRILAGEPLESAIQQTIPLLQKEPDNEETLFKMHQAQDLAQEFLKHCENFEADSNLDSLKQKLVLKHIRDLGRGFVGEEALGVALYCALITPQDPERAICYAVNHEGDSDSTGAIAGNLVGAVYGEAAIPPKWRDNVERGDLIREISRDLLHVADPDKQQEQAIKYPPPITHLHGEDYYRNPENLVVPPFRMPPGSKFFEWANS